jgi:hypothetical protein
MTGVMAVLAASRPRVIHRRISRNLLNNALK